MVYTGTQVEKKKYIYILNVMLFSSCRGQPTLRTVPMTFTLFPKKVTLRTLMVKKPLTLNILFLLMFCFVNREILVIICYLY